MNPLRPIGSEWLVKYVNPEPTVHARIVYGHVHEDIYMTLTPDGDFGHENFCDFSQIAWVRPRPVGRGVPVGINDRDLHDFNPLPTAEESRQLVERAKTQIPLVRGMLGLPELDVTPPVRGRGRGGAAVTRRVAGRSAETPSGPGVDAGGATVPLVDADVDFDPFVDVGPLGGVTPRGAEEPTAGVVTSYGAGGPVGGGLAALRNAIGGGAQVPATGALGPTSDRLDARVLTVQYDAHGQRYRPFREAVADMEEYRWPDWPVTGVMTVLWCLKFMLQKAGSPLAWHAQWKTNGKLSDNDALVMHHEAQCRFLETAACYDQLDLCCLASAELACRQLQVCEERLADKFIDDKDQPNDFYLMSGTSGRSQLCVCPELKAWVAEEARKESAVLKERRKAREERVLARPKRGAG